MVVAVDVGSVEDDAGGVEDAAVGAVAVEDIFTLFCRGLFGCLKCYRLRDFYELLRVRFQKES